MARISRYNCLPVIQLSDYLSEVESIILSIPQHHLPPLES
jgi:hypothetical protein